MAFNPDKLGWSKPAWDCLLGMLADGKSHNVKAVRLEMTVAAPVAWKTTYNMIYEAVQMGLIKKTSGGKWMHLA
ncbi:MAG: hypothetical protein ACREQ5_04645 [Candidatus Dormibacteria bacterium]